eukprot:1448396-Prymnesium_polylepis.2
MQLGKLDGVSLDVYTETVLPQVGAGHRPRAFYPSPCAPAPLRSLMRPVRPMRPPRCVRAATTTWLAPPVGSTLFSPSHVRSTLALPSLRVLQPRPSCPLGPAPC